MPIHDWTRVTAGTFHHFHHLWIAQLSTAVNRRLPSGYYAMAEQVAGPVGPDVLTLQGLGGPPVPPAGHEPPGGHTGTDGEGPIALAQAPPRVAVTDAVSEAMLLAARQRRLVIRHATGDRVVALLEIVSPGNKEKRAALEQFVDKAVGALDEGYHLLVLDLLPPGPGDPRGVHGAIWDRLGSSFDPPPDKPLTLAAYAAGQGAGGAITCYVEPTAVGTALIDMPLFYDPGHYVNVPLEATYLAAYEGVPRRWKRVIEGTG